AFSLVLAELSYISASRTTFSLVLAELSHISASETTFPLLLAELNHISANLPTPTTTYSPLVYPKKITPTIVEAIFYIHYSDTGTTAPS
ncbi:hypothetical protein, partial [Pseudogracilibacillus sp. ICA-222130]|uniref:hypothetical protein n=1 Tax=Pseudogracilibacillus sp. ICA-222130 TaxID=3134655 RepID=UPI0030BD36CD